MERLHSSEVLVRGFLASWLRRPGVATELKLRVSYLPRPPNVPLLRGLWYPLDGIWGLLKGTWGVLVEAWLSRRPRKPRIINHNAGQPESARGVQVADKLLMFRNRERVDVFLWAGA